MLSPLQAYNLLAASDWSPGSSSVAEGNLKFMYGLSLLRYVRSSIFAIPNGLPFNSMVLTLPFQCRIRRWGCARQVGRQQCRSIGNQGK